MTLEQMYEAGLISDDDYRENINVLIFREEWKKQFGTKDVKSGNDQI